MVLFVMAQTLVAQLAKAHAEDRLTHFRKPKLLIVDELRYLPSSRTRPDRRRDRVKH